MERVLRHYNFLDDRRYGAMVKLALQYLAGEELRAGTEDVAFFKIYLEKELRVVLRERKRKQNKRKAGIKNEQE